VTKPIPRPCHLFVAIALLAGCTEVELGAPPPHACEPVWGLGADDRRVYVLAEGEPEREHGFLSLAEALAAAAESGVSHVVIGPGEFPTEVELADESRGLRILGCGRDDTTLVGATDREVLIGGGGESVLSVVGASLGDIVVRDLTIRGGATSLEVIAGASEGAPVRLERVVVEDALEYAVRVGGRRTEVEITDLTIDGVLDAQGSPATGISIASLDVGPVGDQPPPITRISGLEISRVAGTGARFWATDLEAEGLHIHSLSVPAAMRADEFAKGVAFWDATGSVTGLAVEDTPGGGVQVQFIIGQERPLALSDVSVSGTTTVPAWWGDGLVIAASDGIQSTSAVVALDGANLGPSDRANLLVHGATVEATGVEFIEGGAWDAVVQGGGALSGIPLGSVLDLNGGEPLETGPRLPPTP